MTTPATNKDWEWFMNEVDKPGLVYVSSNSTVHLVSGDNLEWENLSDKDLHIIQALLQLVGGRVGHEKVRRATAPNRWLREALGINTDQS